MTHIYQTTGCHISEDSRLRTAVRTSYLPDVPVFGTDGLCSEFSFIEELQHETYLPVSLTRSQCILTGWN
jgi:hypothetical protein